MPALDQYLAREAGVADERLGQAIHAADWSQTFSGPQSDATLRAQRNVTELVNSALDRKMALAAKVDKNAQQIYQNEAKFAEWQEQAPLRDRLLRSRIYSEGASTRFKEHQEAITAEHTAGFMDHMVNAPDETDDSYDDYVLNGLKKYHKVATTSIGKEFLTAIAKGREVAKSLAEIKGANPDLVLDRAKLDRSGNPIETTLVAPEEKQDRRLPDGAITKLAELNANRASVTRKLSKATDKDAKASLTEELEDLDAKIKGWNDTINPPKAGVVTTEVKRRKYNREADKFE